MLQTQSEIKSLLDPRTKLLLVITVATVMIGGSNLGALSYSRYFLAAVPGFLFLLSKKYKTAIIYFLVYYGICAIEGPVLHRSFGLVNFILVAFFMLITRFMPGFLMADYLMQTTTVSAFMASMEKMHLPQAVTIPLAVTFRFFPTIGEEHTAVKNAMNVRGVSFGGGKPLKMLEYRMIPLMISCMNISDELSAAALTRGLGHPGKRTNIARVGFHAADYAAFAICALSWFFFILGLLLR